jgi:hypothetical protein
MDNRNTVYGLKQIVLSESGKPLNGRQIAGLNKGDFQLTFNFPMIGRI